MNIEQLIAKLQMIRHQHYLDGNSSDTANELQVFVSRGNLLNQYSGAVTEVSYSNGKVVVS